MPPTGGGKINCNVYKDLYWYNVKVDDFRQGKYATLSSHHNVFN